MFVGSIAILALALSMNVAHGSQCVRMFSSSQSDVGYFQDDELTENDADQFIQFLSYLLESRSLTNKQMQSFASSLFQGILINPYSPADIGNSGRSFVYSQRFQSFIENRAINLEPIKSWVAEYLRQNKQHQIERDGASVETKSTHLAMTFSKIPPGQFRWRNDYNERSLKVRLTKTIEVMETPVTQMQWVEVMGANPSHFSKGENAITLNIFDFTGQRIILQPDNPVENISWWSALVFANELSKKKRLRRPYDLSGIQFDPGALNSLERQQLRISENTNILRLKSHGPQIRKIAAMGKLMALESDVFPKINSPTNSVYDVEGYRLLTVAEHFYLRHNSNIPQAKCYFGDDPADICDHAWYMKNSNGETHPVALLLPRIFGSGQLFDLMGNVDEMCFDEPFVEFKGGTNPVFDAGIRPNAGCGSGGYFYSGELDKNKFGSQGTVNFGDKTTGLRLARTLNLKK